MPSFDGPALVPDEIDDLLYFARVNEADDLQQTIGELGQKYNCSQQDTILAAVDPKSGNTIIHYCSANGFVDLLKVLLSQLNTQSEANHSANDIQSNSHIVNSANNQGNTPLHWAALNGHLDVVKVLLDAGADMSIRNSAGHLAVFEAEQAGKGGVVEFMLEKSGMDLNPEDLADVSNGDHNVEGDAGRIDEDIDVNMRGSRSGD